MIGRLSSSVAKSSFSATLALVQLSVFGYRSYPRGNRFVYGLLFTDNRLPITQEGVVVPRWVPRSSKSVAGRAERAAVGSTPIHSRHF